MKLLHIAAARAIWLFSTNDLNPKGRALRQEALDAISERYQFQKTPTAASAIEAMAKNEPVYFGSGSFAGAGGHPIAVDLKTYGDGFLVDSRSSTRDSEALLLDLIAWLPEALDLPKVDMRISKKLYVSEMQVEAGELLTLVNPKLAVLAKLLAKSVPQDAPVSYEMSSMSFSTNPVDGPPLLNFKFERLLNSSFSENRYYTAAPIHTDDHWDLLTKLEEVLSDQ